MLKHRQYTYFYIFSRATPNKTFTAKQDNGFLPRTPSVRPKSDIYTPKRDDEHPRPFHMRSPPRGVSLGKTRAIKNEPHSLVTDSSSFSLSLCSPFSEQAIKMAVRWKSNKLSENLSLVPGFII